MYCHVLELRKGMEMDFQHARRLRTFPIGTESIVYNLNYSLDRDKTHKMQYPALY